MTFNSTVQEYTILHDTFIYVFGLNMIDLFIQFIYFKDFRRNVGERKMALVPQIRNDTWPRPCLMACWRNKIYFKKKKKTNQEKKIYHTCQVFVGSIRSVPWISEEIFFLLLFCWDFRHYHGSISGQHHFRHLSLRVLARESQLHQTLSTILSFAAKWT